MLLPIWYCLLLFLVFVQRGFRGGSERVQRGFNEGQPFEPSLTPQYTLSEPSLNLKRYQHTSHTKAITFHPKFKILKRIRTDEMKVIFHTPYIGINISVSPVSKTCCFY